ncbi:MAG TPA: DNA gyrase subunit A [Nitrospinota bacterium]|nr:DNA gyrase subunit A [Nitrospinota bacterium]|tara:strand:- start:28989 stop:31436 length:2448 start_codon:yes stop_codon:yes gene_type:complete
MTQLTQDIIPVAIEDEMKSSFLEYSMSVIVSRALPDVRDGLKPVHRRILYAMNGMGNHHNKAFKKSARTVGEVIAKYHPHGDAAVYDALVRMAQEFSLRYPLVDGQGNFGSVDGDSPAAMRYTEARLHRISSEILRDIDKETVDFTPNYDESELEPVVLPAKSPNLLLNGSNGIAVGMATNIPPHNMGELVNGIISLIDNPNCSVDELMTHITGPDFPTAGEVCGSSGIREAYHKGRGLIVMRGKAEIEPLNKTGRETIVITELPYQVNKARLVEKIAGLVRDKRITGISDLRDESDREGMRIILELKRDAVGQVILNQLYKHTQLQDTFGVIMIALVDRRPRLLNLKEMLHHFVVHRREIIARRTLFDLKKAEEREHILAGFVKALDNLDKVIKLIRAATNPDEARIQLVEKFDFSENQSKAILELRLQRLTGLERQKIVDERKETLARIKHLKFIRDNDSEKYRIIKEELLELKSNYGDDRRTVLVPAESAEVFDEDLIAREDMVVTTSASGYIKRNPLSFYRSQNRKGKGVVGIKMREEDVVMALYIANTHDHLLFFTDTGRVFSKKVYEVPLASRVAKGKAMVNLLQLQPGEKVVAISPVDRLDSTLSLLMATKLGVIKKTPLKLFSKIHTGGIIAIKLDDGDDVIDVGITDNVHNVQLTTKNGMSIRFSESDVRSMGRATRGVRGMRLAVDDHVVGMEIFLENEAETASILSVKQNGRGKRTQLSKYPLQKRGGKGVNDINCEEENGNVVATKRVGNNDQLMVITQNGVVIRIKVSDIPVIGRSTKGVIIMSLSSGDSVVSVSSSAEDLS